VASIYRGLGVDFEDLFFGRFFMNDVQEEDEGDFGDLDSVETEPCPYCGKAVFEQAERCPNCGSYISADDSGGRRPLWVVAGVVITVGAILMVWVVWGR